MTVMVADGPTHLITPHEYAGPAGVAREGET